MNRNPHYGLRKVIDMTTKSYALMKVLALRQGKVLYIESYYETNEPICVYRSKLAAENKKLESQKLYEQVKKFRDDVDGFKYDKQFTLERPVKKSWASGLKAKDITPEMAIERKEYNRLMDEYNRASMQHYHDKHEAKQKFIESLDYPEEVKNCGWHDNEFEIVEVDYDNE